MAELALQGMPFRAWEARGEAIEEHGMEDPQAALACDCTLTRRKAYIANNLIASSMRPTY